jgi:hypothetical protein
MTGANTDRIRTDEWQIASAILLKMSHMVFYAAAPDIGSVEMNHESPFFAAWKPLRDISEIFLSNRSAGLDTTHYEEMTKALKIAHSAYHETVLTSGNEHPLSICDCLIARDVRDLLAFVAEIEETA